MNLIFKNHQSPGDIMMMTSFVRDYHNKYPEDKIRAKTSADSLFANNPNIEFIKPEPRVFNTNADKFADKEDRTDNGWTSIICHYGDEQQLGKNVQNPYSIHKAGNHKKHFMNGMIGYMNVLLGKHIKLTELKPDIYLTEKEKKIPLGVENYFASANSDEDYWVVVPGGKRDYTRKIWAKRNWEELFKLLPETNFVQIGGKEQDHIKFGFPDCKNVLNLTGKTTLRQVLSLIYNAKGVICPITFAMHAAACWPEKRCIVIAGGGEHHTWEAYPGHDFLHTCGVLECCKDGGCWKGKCENLAPDGEQQCMKLITAEMVADIIRGALR